MIKGFNHTSFTVENVDQAVRFWTEALGFRAASVSERSGDWQARITGVPGARLKIAHLFGYGAHVELIEYLEGSEHGAPMRPSLPGTAHVCLDVEDIEETVAVLISRGARRHGELVEVDSGPVRGCRSIYLRDPPGILIELEEKEGEIKCEAWQ
jgi:catechol 2,3-dioxygenase-like lactoylglutathione lyase family enzyme